MKVSSNDDGDKRANIGHKSRFIVKELAVFHDSGIPSIYFTAFLATVVITVLIAGAMWRKAAVTNPRATKACTRNDEESNCETNHSCFVSNGTRVTIPSVKFLALETLDFRDLHNALTAYERERHLALEYLSLTLQVTLESEEEHHLAPILSQRIQEKINRLVTLYEHDQLVLTQQLVVPFSYSLMLPSKEGVLPGVDQSKDSPKSSSRQAAQPTYSIFYNNKKRRGNNTGQSLSTDIQHASYDSVAQVVAHLVRDWSEDGYSIRTSLYGWCTAQVQHYVPKGGSILVPGAGLGRLAWDIAHVCDSFFHVHAVEQSLLMSAAASTMMSSSKAADLTTSSSYLHRTRNASELLPCPVILHPYASDMFTNEVDGTRRYRAVEIARPALDRPLSPPTHSSASTKPSSYSTNDPSVSLTYTVGDFMTVTSILPPHSHNCVLTCFFIDTATNLLEYIQVILRTLHQSDGIWINVGPLQWHRNAQVSVTATELHELLLAYGFDIFHWSIDQEPIEYRSERNTKVPSELDIPNRCSTHYEAYYPLRFVAKLRSSR